MSNMIRASVVHSAGPTTITAGAGATTLVTGALADAALEYAGGANLLGDTVSVTAKLVIENASLLTAATVTVKIQHNFDSTSWVDAHSETYTLRGLIGLVAADRAFVTILASVQYTGTETPGASQARMVISCTGANVSVSNVSLRCQFVDLTV